MDTVLHDLNAYGFQTELRVRLSETDAVGIVFFGSFAVYFDVGRMDYLAHLGLQGFDGAVRDLIPGAVVRQEAHFHSPAKKENDCENLQRRHKHQERLCSDVKGHVWRS